MKNKTNAVQVIARATRCPDFEPDEIFSLMRKLNMNEKGLAILMNVTPATVRLRPAPFCPQFSVRKQVQKRKDTALPCFSPPPWKR